MLRNRIRLPGNPRWVNSAKKVHNVPSSLISWNPSCILSHEYNRASSKQIGQKASHFTPLSRGLHNKGFHDDYGKRHPLLFDDSAIKSHS